MRYVIAFLLLCSSAWGQMLCTPSGEDLADLLRDQHKEERAGAGISSGGHVTTLWVGKHTWTLVTNLPDGRACLMDAGDQWIPATFPPSGESS